MPQYDEGNTGFTPADSRERLTARLLRVAFWILGIALALVQTWTFRHAVTADAVMYLDLSDGSRLGNWHRLISGIWSPLYPFLLGLGLKVFHASQYREIVAAHFLNILILLLAFVCFEFFLSGLVRFRKADENSGEIPMPEWAWVVIGYTVLLWTVLMQITFESLRPDLLMGALMYLAAGVLLRIRMSGATWSNVVGLGAVLGVGYLAKAPMLLVAVVMLGSLLIQERRAWTKIAAAGAVFTVLASLYFVPLSRERGHFSLGDSGAYNYVVHVNHAWPSWYLQDPGSASGSFRHKPKQIFAHPDAYAFRNGDTTYPLRLDPAYWAEGVTPRFHLRAQARAIAENLDTYAGTFQAGAGMIAVLIVLLTLAGNPGKVRRQLGSTWPIWLAGLAGMWMYLSVHVEERYIGVFFSVVFLALLAGLSFPPGLARRVVPGVVLGVAIAVLSPMIVKIDHKLLVPAREEVENTGDAEAARALNRMGLKPGTEVARISPLVTDLGWARLSRVSVIAEVNINGANAFWMLDPVVQDGVLQAFAKAGARAVVARVIPGTQPAGWRHLGNSPYWMRWLDQGEALSMKLPRRL